MFLKNSQKGELGFYIQRHGMQTDDFSLTENEEQNAVTLRHKESDAYFDFTLANLTSFNVEFAPSASTTLPTRAGPLDWSQLIGLLSSWLGYVADEMKAENPWGEAGTSEEFEEDPNALFTPPELVTIDQAVEASFQKLVDEATSNGVEKKLDDVLEDIAELKELARTTPRGKWLERFKDAIATKLIEWGLQAAVDVIGVEVLRVLYETAKPVLKLMAGMP